MSHITPSRRKEERYIPFNNDPRNIGTRTGLPMPQNVPRDSNGFEIPALFFGSSPENGASRTISSIKSKAIQTPGGQSTYSRADSTPGTARRLTRRLSDLDMDDGLRGGDDLLMDEDDLAIATPGSLFANSEPPPSITLPSRSRLPISSPANASFDSVPSPSVRPSPRRSHHSAANRITSSLAKTITKVQKPSADEGESLLTLRNGLNQEEEREGSPVKSKKKTPRVASSDDDGSPTKDKKAASPPKGRSASVSDNEPANDYEGGYEGNHTVDFDDLPPMGPMDDYDIEAALRMEREEDDEDVQNVDDNVVEEERTVEEEEMQVSESEDEEERPPVAAKKKKSPKKQADGKDRARSARSGSVVAQRKRTRPSELGPGDDGYHGNFVTRRSGRQHYKPLEFWRGEKVEYMRGPGCAVIKEIVTIPEDPPVPLAARRSRKNGRARDGSVAVGKRKREDSVEDEEGWDHKTEPTGLVQDYPFGEECYRKIACPKALLDPKLVSGGNFKYQKVFGEGHFMAAGIVYIPVGQIKNTKPSKDNTYVFYVIQGAVQVTIYRTSFVMAPGSQFLVPRGNDYCIENISPDKEAQLFFAQARKIRANEVDADGVSESQAGEAGLPSRKSMGTSQNHSQSEKKNKRLPLVREESRDISQSEREDEEDDEEEEIIVKKKRKSKGKSRR
ncbi:centromere protein C [Cryptococcus neoformans A2-102-5]|nr:centromere protein C [Cryptococcus neoformans var. grubii D17-1]OXG90413.1 centromere protein C [Cryptococcus neoformans var. grubii A2-102-5]